MQELVKCQRSYKIKIFPNKGKSEHLRYSAMRFNQYLNYFATRSYFGTPAPSTQGMGKLANTAKHKAGGIARALRAKDTKTSRVGKVSRFLIALPAEAWLMLI